MKRCPECKQILPDYADTCPECMIDVNSGKPVKDIEYIQKYAGKKDTDSIEEPDRYNEYIEVLITFNQTDIAFIKSLFDGEKIHYFLKGEHFMNMRPIVQPVCVMVKDDEVEKAKEILKDMDIAFSGFNTQSIREDDEK